MRRRAHLRAGEMEDLLHRPAAAKQQYDAVLALGMEYSQAAEAEKFEKSPYTGK
jgi:hypothetical protein